MMNGEKDFCGGNNLIIHDGTDSDIRRHRF
jgi:hypothetical protein